LWMFELKIVLVAVFGYLLGSANTSLIVGKFYGIDVRKHGSGNAGATNTLRTMGKSAALLVGLGDVLKGIIACLIGVALIGANSVDYKLGLMVGGVAAILGHNWPIYFGFKGGKGIFTSYAVIMMMNWKIGLILLGVFIIILALTRFVSLGSMIGSALFPIIALIPVFGESYVFVIFALFIGALAIFKHRSNLARIFQGTESKLGAKKSA
jgi:acyl phosphate:glycerol-3-phosphate acyltransferase